MNLTNDMVHHPNHYNILGRKECFEEMLENFGAEAVRNFCLLNVYKYHYRSDFKNGNEDIKKAENYADKFLEMGGNPHLLTKAVTKARGGLNE